MANKNTKSKLQQAASRKLQGLGAPKLSPQEIAHMMFHAEERGEVERVGLDDGSWAWALPAQEDGRRPLMKPTPEILAHLQNFQTHHEPHA